MTTEETFATLDTSSLGPLDEARLGPAIRVAFRSLWNGERSDVIAIFVGADDGAHIGAPGTFRVAISATAFGSYTAFAAAHARAARFIADNQLTEE